MDNQDIKDATIEGSSLTGKASNERIFKTTAPYDPTLVKHLIDHGVNVRAQIPSNSGNFLTNLLLSVLPVILLIVAWGFVMRQMQGGGRGGAVGA